ncbi:MAG TPA: T9SS type A sorting domain-containing protein, partial [Niastella sp.]
KPAINNDMQAAVVAVTVRPNPVSTQLTINMGKVENNAVVQIYNSAGVLMYNRRITNTTIDIPAAYWKAGIYWVNVINGDQRTVKKIVKL